MTDHERPSPDDDDDDLGEPIAELAALRVEPKRDLITAVAGSIARRNLAADLVELGSIAPVRVFIEYLDTAMGALMRNEEDEDEGET